MLMHTIVWEYRVRPESVDAFVAAYGGAGAWAQLFANADGYLGTTLYLDVDEPDRYLTFDRWSSRDAFTAFMADYAAAYATLDAACDEMTLEQTRIGALDG